MQRTVRAVLGFALMAIGALGTVAGAVRASPGTGTRPNAPLVPRSGSRLVAARAASSRRPPIIGEAVVPTEAGDLSRSTAGTPRIRVDGELRAAVESRTQQLVADQLGVDIEELVPETSLTDDLAADSMDLLELALVLESQFTIAFPQRTIDRIRTYRDLVDAVMASFDGRQRRERLTSRRSFLKARVVAARDQSASLERADELTPYAMEVIAEDAARAGRGARLEVTMPASADDVDLAVMRGEFAWLGHRGVDVTIRRDASRGDEA